MSWTQIQLSISPEESDQIQALLQQAGAVSVTLLDDADQPLYEPGPGQTPLWNHVRLIALFEGKPEADTLLASLSGLLPDHLLQDIKIEELLDQQWERTWIDNFKPIRFGKRLWVCPSWEKLEQEDAVIMQLDPGLAFGTGTHPTTALCLTWLDNARLEGSQLIDYGCGSGILGIAALLLGAAEVSGVDTDPQALLATTSNCEKNAINEAQFPLYLPHDFARQLAAGNITQVDGVMANILAGPLVELASYLSAMVHPDGFILLSGILESQAEEVIHTYQQWFDLDPVHTREEWCCISGIKKSSQ